MADGSVVIDTKIDTSGVEKGMEDIKNSLKRMSDSVDGLGKNAKSSIEKQVSSLSKMNTQLGKQVDKVNLLQEKLEDISSKKVETEEYKKLGKEIDDLYKKSAKVESELNQWRNLGVPETSSTFKKKVSELEKISEEIDKLYAKQEEMKKSGTAYVNQKETEDYKNTVGELNSENEKLKEMNGGLSASFLELKRYIAECQSEAAKSSSVIGKLGQKVENFATKLRASGIAGLKKKIRDIGNAISALYRKLAQLAAGAIVAGLKKISSGIFGIHKSANKSTISLKNMLRYAFGIRSLFALLNRLRSAAAEGMQNLAKYDLATGADNINRSISELQSALTQLKNSFATAFAPILTVVSPILVRFINLISQAVTRVGMLIAALTGQKTFTKAIAVQENYAASLDNTADSAKKAAKALQGYLSPIDEINRYDDGKDSSGSTGSGGKYTGPSAGDMFEEVPIESSLKGIADKIKELIRNEDWEGLGAYMADGINKGLQKVYNVINWDNVGPKITAFVRAFTETFNSLVDHIDWDLMGRTLGAGINTVVKSLNLAITGIDWYNLGRKFAAGIRGIVTEVKWNEVGQLIGNKFMAAWRVFGGFVKNIPYRHIGKAVADGLNGVFEKISFSEIAGYLTTAINGAFNSLNEFVKDFSWDDFAENVKNGIIDFLNGVEWKKNGAIFGEFLSKLCDTINASITEETFYDLGKGIGDFLGQLPWGKLLATAAKMIISGLKGALEGLWESEGLPGKIAAVIIAAFGAIKLGTLLAPIKTLVGWIIGKIAARMMAAESTAAISDSVGNMLNTALSGAATGAKDFATALGPLVGTAGLIIGVGAAATVATSELAGFVETMQGGNSIGGTFGNTMNNFIQTLQRRGDIISGSAEEIWQLKESLEKEEMTAGEKAEATQKLIDKLGEMGVTSDQAEQAFSSLYQQGLITDDMFGILSESIKTLGDNTTNMAGSIDLSKQSIDDLYDNVLPQLQTQLGLSADQVTSLDTALLETESSGGTAQDAFNRIMERAEELGINTESVAKIFAEVFPDAVRETESSTKTSMENTQKSVETGMGAASAAAGAAMAGVQKSTEDAMNAASKSVTDNSEDIATTSKDKWEDSSGYVLDNLETIKGDTKRIMGKVMTTVQSYWSSVLINTNQIWEAVAKKIEKELGNALTAAERISSEIIGTMNGVISKINGSIGNINNALSGIERSFTFTYNYTNPITKRPGTYRSWLNLPSVNTVPYLATGAVIPPRSEFLAVLGDQKNGRNLEAPESLLRQIVREESGGNQGKNIYDISVSASGRTLLDIILEEGELRRNRNGGRNPFKLDE